MCSLLCMWMIINEHGHAGFSCNMVKIMGQFLFPCWKSIRKSGADWRKSGAWTSVKLWLLSSKHSFQELFVFLSKVRKANHVFMVGFLSLSKYVFKLNHVETFGFGEVDNACSLVTCHFLLPKLYGIVLWLECRNVLICLCLLWK